MIHYRKMWAAAKQVLEAIFDDAQVLNRKELEETPRRFASMWAEVLAGYDQDPKTILKKFDNDFRYDEMIVCRDIDFTSFCEHHLLPFQGVAHVGYIPNHLKIVGLSKLARVVDCFAKRLQVQERLTQQIVHSIDTHLEPIGVGCVVEAKHQCLGCRGAKKPNAVMVTSALRGAMKTDPSTRSEFMRLIGK